MNESKTIIEWFEQLPDGYRERAINNARTRAWKCESIADALNDGFDWLSSPEGYDFWDAVYMHYIDSISANPLPSLDEVAV